MVYSPTVHDRYTLCPQDLTAPLTRVTVANVSYQGLERLTPVLHLAEYPHKRLVLNRQQCAALIQVTQSAAAQHWVGQQIVLRIEEQEGAAQLAIAAPLSTHKPRAMPRIRIVSPGTWGSTLWLLLILAAAFGAAYLLENLEQLW